MNPLRGRDFLDGVLLVALAAIIGVIDNDRASFVSERLQLGLKLSPTLEPSRSAPAAPNQRRGAAERLGRRRRPGGRPVFGPGGGNEGGSGVRKAPKVKAAAPKAAPPRKEARPVGSRVRSPRRSTPASSTSTPSSTRGGEAAGTGMVVTSYGEVITNNHVIAGATAITATDIGNGTTYTARVVGYDRTHDVAVLQLEGASGLDDGDARRLLERPASVQRGRRSATPAASAARRAPPAARSPRSPVDHRQRRARRHHRAADRADPARTAQLQPGDSGGPLVERLRQGRRHGHRGLVDLQLPASLRRGLRDPDRQVVSIASQIDAGHGTSTIHIGATALIGVLIRSQGSEGALVEDVLSGGPAAGRRSCCRRCDHRAGRHRRELADRPEGT